MRQDLISLLAKGRGRDAKLIGKFLNRSKPDRRQSQVNAFLAEWGGIEGPESSRSPAASREKGKSPQEHDRMWVNRPRHPRK